ncbi:MAG: NAD(P)/FAD-dependent oxidoreductase [Butyrivibrio sp.]|nr:NAD(P)/FAD-dependent oxidoreductase [Butyrivibrio sp.]
MKKIAVIGCGAAGMMAALAAANSGGDVTLFEKNEKPGKKIYITGKGRCNVTNSCEVEDYFGFVKRNPRFLYSAIYDFDNQAVMNFFEENGCHLKTERGGRVFPVSDHSSDIINTLYRAVQRAGVKIELGTEVTSIETKNQAVTALTYSGKDKTSSREEFEAVIVCTGGVSYPSTGSTGDGYKFAKELGHNVISPVPSLVPFEISEKWCRDLQGLSLKNVGLKLFIEGSKKNKPVYDGFGEMLFTHFGVSGPLVLTASCHYEKDKNARLLLDLKPALSEEQLDKRVLRDFEEGLNKQFKNVIGGLFPSKLVPVMIELSGINPEKPVHEITKEERSSFVKLIKNIPMTVTGTRGFNEAIITRGGVSVKEINPSTMESKLVKGLFFAGEVIDVDTETGGFNLQVAWSTGHLAGVSCV